jgi:hypothetical protein
MLAALERLIALRHQHRVLLATDRIDRVTGVLSDMELIEGNFVFCLWHALQRGIDERWPHVHRDAVYGRELLVCQLPYHALSVDFLRSLPT